MHFFPVGVWFKEEILGYRDLKTIVKEHIHFWPVSAFAYWLLTESPVKQQKRKKGCMSGNISQPALVDREHRSPESQ